jgi:hypothetical protein
VCGKKVQNSGENIKNSGEYKLHHILLDVDLWSSLQRGANGTLFRFSTSRLGKETYADLLPKEFADGKSRMTHIVGDGNFFPLRARRRTSGEMVRTGLTGHSTVTRQAYLERKAGKFFKTYGLVTREVDGD